MRLLLPLLSAVLLAGPSRAEPPEDVDTQLARAIRLHRGGDVLGAIDAYEGILEGAPDRSDVRSNLGAALVRLGRYDDAIEQYRRALAPGADDPAIRFNLGLALYKTTRFPEAAVELARVVERQPGNASAVLLLAECRLQAGENRQVIDLLTPLEKAQEENRAFAFLLGTALLREGEMERGRVWIDRVLRGGDSAEARLVMGAAHLQADDFLAARRELARAVELNADLPTLNSLYGQVLQRVGEPEAAEQAFLRELRVNPNDFHANLQLGNLRREDGRYDDAAAYLTRASRLRAEDPSLLYALGSLYTATGDDPKALAALEGLVAQSPDFAPAHVLLARVYHRLNRKADIEREIVIVRRLEAERLEKERKKE